MRRKPVYVVLGAVVTAAAVTTFGARGDGEPDGLYLLDAQ